METLKREVDALIPNHKFKKVSFVLLVVTAMGVASLAADSSKLEAYNFEGHEAEWTQKCSQLLTKQEDLVACQAYKQYIDNKVANSQDSVNKLIASIDSVKSDLSNLKDVSQKYADSIASVESEISAINTSLATMQANVDKLTVSIADTKVKIVARTDIIKKRMIEMQPSINTNQFIQYVMGAEDLVDLVQRASSVESFTKNDKEQIKKLNAEQTKLENEQKEQKRMQDTLKIQQQNLALKQSDLNTLKKANDALVAEYEVKVATLTQQKNEAAANTNALANMSPTITFDGGGAVIPDVPNTKGLIAPIQGSYISRGIQVGHRGVDWAAGMGTPIVAPANCYVVFACSGFGSGYLGNMDGYQRGAPYGGGNSVRIIFSINGTTYAMNFHHMKAASGTALASAGTANMVAQGTVIGWVGSSGNSSGPHAHCELFVIHQSLQQAVATWYKTGDWQSGCGWGLYTPASGSYATRVDPLAYF